MNVLLAALDDSAAARPVLAAARRVAPYVDADVVGVHVREDGSGSTARALADAAEVPLLVRDADGADVVAELGAALHELQALAIVAGARRVPAGAQPAGHVAIRLVQEMRTAVVIVPPDAEDRPILRVLVSVEGNGESDALVAFIDRLDELPGPEVPDPEVVALHVFEPADLPLFGDEPVLETEAWAHEFLRRVASSPIDRIRLEVRVGNVADVVPASAQELGADLVVMGWHGSLSGGHGRVVRRMLEQAIVPVMLLPIGRTPFSIGSGAAQAEG
jgi:nucleotide-binding universal stress UspA family protein